MNKFDGVANTLFVPLVARINISKKFPEYFMDEKALELEKYLPQGADKGSSEYSNMASVARYKSIYEGCREEETGNNSSFEIELTTVKFKFDSIKNRM